MELRATAADDLPALYELFIRAIAGVYRPHGFDPPAPPYEVFASQQRHVLDHDAARCRVAEEQGRLLGCASAWLRGDDWFLASLFVADEAQGRGVGGALLEAVWGDARRRRTISDAIQPVSNALYARAGLIPATPVLTFAGTPARAREALSPAGDGDVAEIDRAGYGFDRAVDHAHWGRGGRRTLWSSAGVAAYSYAFPGGVIGPVAGVDPDAAAAALEGELARAPGAVRVRIPGSARQLVAVALRAGLRLAPVPGLLLLSEGAAPPEALAIGSYTLL